MRVRVLAEAAEELAQAALWYDQESPDLGLRLIEAFENAVQLLREELPPLVTMGRQAGSLGAKRIILHRFPFSVVVLEREDEFVVVALAHFARRPGYWKERALT